MNEADDSEEKSKPDTFLIEAAFQAYADGDISLGRARECAALWAAGQSFSLPAASGNQQTVAAQREEAKGLTDEEKALLQEALQAIEDRTFDDRRALEEAATRIPSLTPEAVEAAWRVMSDRAHIAKRLRFRFS